ncbi:tyrosine-type recombinase/integrase [Glycomyces sp. TRM65418]|uniref:tyrosine-type recombinase/integrase n=1 Tax=Glycomyces sp. TRM65418 TaxID=2867006 RepID=UPI001CE55A0C|nr:tyrosine-type recombinase/integrase [Glycomyces sp. TRM65418]MCC3762637.1 tyrosine-type recombinase/integrase [Glycomyces sp. TRM65418]QZD56674.1 tyrosine-type recombinase/integrase [Glycomyces sp. TRM65418]
MEIEPCWDVSLYKIDEIKSATKRPWRLRWRVGKLKRPPFTRYFTSENQAGNFKKKLEVAIIEGRAFDLYEGLPADMLRAKREAEAKTPAALATVKRLSLYDHARDYAVANWAGRAANTRVGNADGLRDILIAVLPEPPKPVGELRLALRNWALNPSADMKAAPPAVTDLLAWAAEHSPAVADLADLGALHDLLEALTLCHNGKKASARHFDKRKGTLAALLKHAVVKGELDDNPLHNPRLAWHRPSDYRGASAVDPREVGTREQVEALIAAVSYTWPSGGSYVAFLGCLYYGMMRPEEAAALKLNQCDLPATGWGTVTLSQAATQVGRLWTDTGTSHEVRGLKHRSSKDVRIVPIPPRLVELINTHVDRYGTSRGGTLFRSATGRKVSPGTVWLLSRQAREYAFGPAERLSNLLKRPYSLRHSGISLRLYAGVPPVQVAAWAGHSVEVLLRIYANVIGGYENRWQGEIDKFLGE